MTRLVAPPVHALDFDVRSVTLPRGGTVLAARSVSYAPGRTRLAGLGEHVMLLDSDTGAQRCERSGSGDIALIPSDTGGPGWCAAGYASRPIAFSEDGGIRRWWPGREVEGVVTASALRGAWPLVGLPAQGLLVHQPRDGETWTAYLPGTPSDRVGWALRGTTVHLLPLDDRVLLETSADPDVVRAVAWDSGRELWRQRLAPALASFIGIVDDALWVSLADGGLAALSISTGAVRSRVPSPAPSPRAGVLDPRGVLHVCSGPLYERFDLCDGGRCVERRALSLAGEPLAPAYPRLALVSVDGCLWYADERQRVLMLEPGGQPEILARGTARTVSLEAGADVVYALDAVGTLRAMGR